MDDLYFKSEASEFIFILVKLDGDVRLKFLGVNKTHFRNKEIAIEWYNNILNILHTESTHPLYNYAMIELNELYKAMIK